MNLVDRRRPLDLAKIQRPQNTRSYQSRHARQPYLTSPVTKPAAPWRNWREVGIKLEGIGTATSTFSLWKEFSRQGEVAMIEIYEDRERRRDGTAKIIFRPPPKQDFWTESREKANYPLRKADGTHYMIRVTLFQPKYPLHIQSPTRNHIYYRPELRLHPWSLDFGLMEKENVFMTLQRVMPSEPIDMTFAVDLKRLSRGVPDFVSSTTVGQCDRNNTFMFFIPFGQLKDIKRIEHSEEFFGLALSLDSPPQYFRKRTDEDAGHTSGNLFWTEFDTWYRQTDIEYDPYRLPTAKISLHKQQPEIDIGRWTTYLFTFQNSKIDTAAYAEMQAALRDFNIEIVPSNDTIDWEPRASELWNLIDPPIAQDTAAELLCLEANEATSYSLPFEVRYQLEVCISRGYLNEYNIAKDFVRELSILSNQDLAKARNLLEYVAEQDRRIFDPMSIFEDPNALAYSPRTEIPHYCAHVRKATITPTTVYFSSPTVETTNRVLRRYAQENRDGRFLRVQFTDEVFEGRINSSANQNRNDELFTRVYRTLYNGIQIGDRHYQFLAFGNSQFRENGAYFFCPTADLSCDDIRGWMGNFSHIKVAAKYAARLGQCFSTTRAINGLSNPKLVRINDVERGGFCFTDGVGKISLFMAQMIATELGLQGSVIPSAFQFRLGGCKGLLVVWPDAKEKEVHIRPSQHKFPATYNGLEIIRCSHFSAATLNRQTITILSALGVPDNVFLTMLADQLSNYSAAMENDDLAVSLLCRYIDDAQMTINIATMVRNGFMAQRDPFVTSLLHLWRAWSIKLLKEKAKIIVENGAFVFGCIDETATLRGYTKPTIAKGEEFPDDELPQIFLQVPDKIDPNKFNVIEGRCLVGRNPSLHPGDLRVVQAINVPALHHLRNVVVFPQLGDRDIPSMCSGGDLDGDDYFVIWDKDLSPPQRNCEPMSYAAPNPKESRRPVKTTDLMKFFVLFMKNDALPAIAHAHLAQSDYLLLGVQDPKCLELAKLHSKAVDYVKTGQPAEMPKYLRPRKWPHFMEKRFKPKDQQYVSSQILGQLYDRVESVKFIPQWDLPFDPRILRAYKLQDSTLKTARQIKTQYDLALRRLLANQRISTEFEVWSTFVLSKPVVGSDYKFQEDIARLSDSLKDQFRSICIERAGGKDFATLGPLVAAMYKVTKEELDIALAECRSTKLVGGRQVPRRKMEPKYMPLISFPWLFEKELGRIATGVDTSATYDELGILSLGYKADGLSRKRQGGGLNSSDDFVQREDGVVVHRGEELDLFRADAHDDIYDDVSEEGLDDQDGRAFAFRDLSEDENEALGELVSLSGTGVEDVVAPAKLDGLMAPEESARRLHKASGFQPPFVQWKVSQEQKSSTTPDQRHCDWGLESLQSIEIKSTEEGSQVRRTPLDSTLHNESNSAETTYEDTVDLNVEKSKEEIEVINKDVTDEEVEEQIEDGRESAMERLARMTRG